MTDLEHMIAELENAIGAMQKDVRKLDEYVNNIAVYYGGTDRMKNCVNCEHFEVCLVVAQRKARKANDYSPCSKWKLSQ